MNFPEFRVIAICVEERRPIVCALYKHGTEQWRSLSRSHRRLWGSCSEPAECSSNAVEPGVVESASKQPAPPNALAANPVSSSSSRALPSRSSCDKYPRGADQRADVGWVRRRSPAAAPRRAASATRTSCSTRRRRAARHSSKAPTPTAAAAAVTSWRISTKTASPTSTRSPRCTSAAAATYVMCYCFALGMYCTVHVQCLWLAQLLTCALLCSVLNLNLNLNLNLSILRCVPLSRHISCMQCTLAGRLVAAADARRELGSLQPQVDVGREHDELHVRFP